MRQRSGKVMAKTQAQTEILLRAKDLRIALSGVRGKPVPDRTLRYWRSQLGISPDSMGFYQQSQLEVLIGLVKALKQGLNTFQYFELLRQRCGNA